MTIVMFNVRLQPAKLSAWFLDTLMQPCSPVVTVQAAVLDFFGVPVKAQDVLGRIKELTLLGKRIKRFKDPVAQFRLKSHPRVPSWSKACGWTQGNTTSCMLILMHKFHLFDHLICFSFCDSCKYFD